MKRLSQIQHETVEALRRFGVAPHASSIRGSGAGVVFRFADPRDARRVLRQRTVFAEGPLGMLHGRDVGGLVTEFRSYRGWQRYSLHVVLGREGAVFADLDRFNPYQGVRHLLLHGMLELAPYLVRRALSASWRR